MDAITARRIAIRVILEDLVHMKEWKRLERRQAWLCGVKWRHRGPTRPVQKRKTWLGQRWREGPARWANRVGKERDRYKSYFRQKHTFCKPKPVT